MLAGAALAASACGGVLGAELGAGVRDLPDIACTVQAASVDDQNYGAAVFEVLNRFPFAGAPADDLRRPEVRRRVFSGHVERLKAAQAAAARLRPDGDVETTLVRAVRADLEAALALARFEARWAPGDPDAPFPPERTADRLDSALESASPEVQRLFADCELPADVARREEAYSVE